MTKVIEVDEAGQLVLPPELLSEAKPRARYVVATEGSTIVVHPEAVSVIGTAEKQSQTYEQWKQSWTELTEEIGKVWPAGLSAVDAVSEQRR